MEKSPSLSKSGICEAFNLTEATLAHLEDLELFDSSDGKVVRGERRYVVDDGLRDVFELGRAHFSSVKTKQLPLFPFQRAIVFYLLSGGPKTAFKILNDRGFVSSNRPSDKYFQALHNKLIDLAPKVIKKWVAGEEEEPTDENEKAVELYLDILGLADFWDDPDQVELSFLYDDIRVRILLEAMLCTQAKYEEIADVLSIHFDMEVSPVDIEVYHNFYFDRSFLDERDWKLWLKGLGDTHQTRVKDSVDLTFSEFARKYRITKYLNTSEEIDAMLAVSQQGFWQHKEAAAYGSMDAIKKQAILITNSLKLFEARMSLAPTDVSSVNDRLKMEFTKPANLKIVNREDFDPNEIDSPKIAKEAGLRDPSAKEQGA